MPAPGRRNVGASLAEAITKTKRTDSIPNAGDRHVATRNRHATKWEDANARLGPATTATTTERPSKERPSRERGKRQSTEPTPPIGSVSLTGRLPEARSETPSPRGRYVMECIDCPEKIRLHRLTPRVPLCTRCKAAREQRKIARRRRTAGLLR